MGARCADGDTPCARLRSLLTCKHGCVLSEVAGPAGGNYDRAVLLLQLPVELSLIFLRTDAVPRCPCPALVAAENRQNQHVITPGERSRAVGACQQRIEQALVKVGITNPPRGGDTVAGFPPDTRKPAVGRSSVNRETSRSLTASVGLLCLADHRIRLPGPTPREVMSCRPVPDVPLLEHRCEYCAIERSSGGDNRWRQPFRRELVEPSLIVIGVEIVRTRPCPAIVSYPDCCIAGVAWITGDVHPCHPHSLRHELSNRCWWMSALTLW